MQFEKDQDNKKKKIIIIAAAILLVVIAAILIFYFGSQIRATTMRILRLEGEVSLEDNGKNKKVKESLRLNDGNALTTETESLVSIGLDDTKIVTMDEKSRAEFSQKGRKLDLHLTAGSLFFEVQKPLEDDETFDIRTSTMVVGIRGTSGWVSVEGDHETLIVTDGIVHVIGINPTTGETKEIDVGAGQRVRTYLYNDRKVDSIMFYLERITERDLPEFVLERLRENPKLLDKVVAQTGWDKPWILGIVKPTPTPTPTPEPEKESDGDGLKDVTPTPAPTQEATKESQNKNTEQEQLEQLLALMKAMITPTPTPTPIPEPEPVQSSSSDDEEEPEPTAAPTPTSIPNYVGPGSYTTDTSGNIIMPDGTTIRYRNFANPPMANYTPGATIDVSGTGLEITDNSVTPAAIRTITSMTDFDFQGSDIPTTLTKTVNGKTYKAERVYDPNDSSLAINTLYEDGVVMTPPAGSIYPNPSTDSAVGGGTDITSLMEEFNVLGYNL
jgi:hypothetical protein